MIAMALHDYIIMWVLQYDFFPSKHLQVLSLFSLVPACFDSFLAEAENIG